MNSERWQTIEDTLQMALDRAPDERAAFLAEACNRDGELRAEVGALLQAHDDAGEFLEESAMKVDARVLANGAFDSMIGRVIGRYRIVDLLGSGGMGEVFLAEDERLERPVALKILPPWLAYGDASILRFNREARAASALNHPNILTIHEIGETEDARYIATEYIDGQTLRELLEERELLPKEILDISIQVVTGLEAAHAAGIVHRDIKPENIMRRGDGIVKILDFGIAKLTEHPISEAIEGRTFFESGRSDTIMQLGTPRYMSPEQARGSAVDERSDIWSFGVVLFEMIDGHAPFTGTSKSEIISSVLDHEPQQLDRLSASEFEGLQVVVSRCLAKDREQRYQHVSDLLGHLLKIRKSVELASLLQNKPGVPIDDARNLASQSVSPLTEAHAAFGFTRSMRAVLAVAICVLIVLAGLFLYRRSVTRRQNVSATTPAPRMYAQMNEAQKLAFIDEQEQRISAMMGDRPAKLNDEALQAIKSSVDAYAARTGSTSREHFKEDLSAIYLRAVPFVPLIDRSFKERNVPAIVGIYLPMIESEYTSCFENEIGAKGIYQFLPATAEQYGVTRDEMCDVNKMTPAAAHYIADRMAELGDDAESMTLVLLSYNRGAEWVRSALRELRDSNNYERNFWTLYSHRDSLDQTFRDENAVYVPRFFAAAIIGENPQAFGLTIKPLSSLASDGNAGRIGPM